MFEEERRRYMHGGAPPGAQEISKQGLIKKIFEDFKVISERELFDIVNRQR